VVFLVDFPVVLLAVFFTVFIPSFFFEPDLLEAVVAFVFLVAAAWTSAADFFAFLTTFETACTGAESAAAFLTRLTTASAAECARMVAPLITRSPTIAPISCFG